VDELPLLELFTRLRQAGLPLGIDDYQAVLKSLQVGYGLPDRVALARLCRLLWVRSPNERQLFDYYFEQLMDLGPLGQKPKKQLAKRQRIILASAGVGIVIAGIGLVWWFNPPRQNPSAPDVPPLPTQPSIASPSSPSPSPSPVQSPESNYWNWIFVAFLVLGLGSWLVWLFMRWRRTQSTPSVTPPQSTQAATSKTTVKPPLLSDICDEVQIAQMMWQVNEPIRNVRDRFTLSTDFLPVTQRQMKQSWRYLRQMVREGLSTELDIEVTVQQIARCGVLLEPVLIPPRMNRTELLLLIDREGSMVAFRALAERLAETASRGGRLGKMGTYYFRNCPIHYVYRDPFHLDAEPVGEVLARLRRDRTVVLIFSDAGAARGGLNLERVDMTKKFLSQIKPHVRRVAWLNPMPQKRWIATTAIEIAQFVPMFEATRFGMAGAINSLRGKHYSVLQSLGDKA